MMEKIKVGISISKYIYCYKVILNMKCIYKCIYKPLRMVGIDVSVSCAEKT